MTAWSSVIQPPMVAVMKKMDSLGGLWTMRRKECSTATSYSTSCSPWLPCTSWWPWPVGTGRRHRLTRWKTTWPPWKSPSIAWPQNPLVLSISWSCVQCSFLKCLWVFLLLDLKSSWSSYSTNHGDPFQTWVTWERKSWHKAAWPIFVY